jgi:hypothetical protein
VGVSGRTEKDGRGHGLAEELEVLDDWSEAAGKLPVVGAVKGREELRVVRLPSTEPVAGLEKESFVLLLRGEFSRQ